MKRTWLPILPLIVVLTACGSGTEVVDRPRLRLRPPRLNPLPPRNRLR